MDGEKPSKIKTIKLNKLLETHKKHLFYSIEMIAYLESFKIRKQYFHGLDTSLLGCKFGQLNSKTSLF
ncbi:MAG: hypothetical protein RLZ13_1020 [Bacteroidota bacterium]|jgi:hypothetical protein